MNRDLIEVVQRFDQARVLLVGDFMLDRYVVGDAERISPEAPVPVLRVVERQDRVGGAGSVALNVLSLGAQVRCFGLLGQDSFGNQTEKLLSGAGANTAGLLRVDDRPTITKTRMVGLAEHRHRQQILRVDDELVCAPREPDAQALVQSITTAIPDADMVCLEDYAKGLLSPEICAAVIKAAERHGKPVYVDPARTPAWEKYRGAALLTPNWAELELAVGRRLERGELADAAAGLIEQFGLGAIVVTLGRDGALLVGGDGRRAEFPTTPRAVYDNTGAGDAVLAMMAGGDRGRRDGGPEHRAGQHRRRARSQQVWLRAHYSGRSRERAARGCAARPRQAA